MGKRAGRLSAGLLTALLGCGDDGSGSADTSTDDTGSSGGATTMTPPESTGGIDSTGGADSTGTVTTDGPSGPLQLQLLAFNDFHGHLEPPPAGPPSDIWNGSEVVTAGGAAYLAHDVARLRDEAEHSLTVTAGDLIGASPLVSGLLHDEPTIEVMNQLGLDIAGIGNHEFDDGVPELLRMAGGGCHPDDGCTLYDPFVGADFEFLAANARYADTGDTIFPSVAIREIDGVSVAFIGMTLENTAGVVMPAQVEGIQFDDEVETVQALVPDLQAEGIETIVVLLHQGGHQLGNHEACAGVSGPIVAIAEGMPDAVDVMVTGHTHNAYICTINDILVTSAASNGKLITDIDLEIDRDTGDVIAAQASNVIVERDELDDGMQDLVDVAVEFVAPIANAQVGAITEDLLRDQGTGLQSALGGVIADAQLAAVADPVDGGAQLALMNPGGIRADLLYAASGEEAQDGIVTYGEVAAVHPFGNSVVTMTLTGAQLEAILEEQFAIGDQAVFAISEGFTYAYSASAAGGNKIDSASMMLDGMPIAPDDEVRVAVNDFVATGGGPWEGFEAGTEVTGGPVDVEALVTYFEANSPIEAPPPGRVTELP